MAYGDLKDLLRRTGSNKVFYDKAFNIAKNWKNNGYQRRLASIARKCFDKNSSIGAVTRLNESAIKIGYTSNQRTNN